MTPSISIVFDLVLMILIQFFYAKYLLVPYPLDRHPLDEVLFSPRNPTLLTYTCDPLTLRLTINSKIMAVLNAKFKVLLNLISSRTMFDRP